MRLPARLWKLRFDWRSAIWQAAEGICEYGDALCREVLQDFGGCVVELGGGGVSGLTHPDFLSFLANLAIVRNPSSARAKKIEKD